MGIYIKGMEMPKSCHWCPLLVSIDGADDHAPFCYCALDHFKVPCTPEFVMTRKETMEKRHEYCPLVPVPPHGRLIDADALLESIKEAKKKQPEISDVYDDDYFAVAEWVSYAPTVIEAEEGE